MKVKSKDIKAEVEPKKSLRNLVKDEDKKNKSFEEAMEEVWNPEI